MDEWITISDGEYPVASAFLIAPGNHAVELENTTLEIYSRPDGRRGMEGKGLVENIRVVELLEYGEELDLILAFDEEIIFLMKNPTLHGGKVFAANVKSTMRFSPRIPWDSMAPDAYESLRSQLKLGP